MAKVLSQEEIDQLLLSMENGEVRKAEEKPEPKYTKYDFRRALHFSKDHFRIISRIHEHFARTFTNYLTTRLRVPVHLQVESIDELPYEEFMRSIAPLTVLQLISLEPLQGKIVVDFNMQAVFAMLDYVMGGTGQKHYEERDLTEIEVRLFHNLIGEMANLFASSWDQFVHFQPQLGSVETNPQFVQIASPNESVLVITLSIKIEEMQGLINFCIPYIAIEDVVPKLTTRSYFSTQFKEPEEKIERFHHEIGGHIEHTELELRASLAETTVTLHEVLELKAGDLIRLDKPIRSPAFLYSNEVPVYIGNIGTSSGRYAIQIIERWEEGLTDGRKSTVSK